MANITIVGSGGWGTAIATLLNNKNHNVYGFLEVQKTGPLDSLALFVGWFIPFYVIFIIS